MRYVPILLLSWIVFTLSITSCKQFNARSAVRINDEVILYQKNLMTSLEAFVAALNGKDKIAIEKALVTLRNSSEEGLSHMKSLMAPDCNKEFIPAAQSMFDYYLAASKKEYKAIADLYVADSISYEAFDSLQLLVDKFKIDQEKANLNFLDAQKKFAIDCQFKLVRNAR